jgi:hypothetical protein
MKIQPENGLELGGHVIRVPLKMLQLTERDGRVYPVAFEWHDANGDRICVNIERVTEIVPFAEQKSGTVGDRFTCSIEGRTEYLFYGRMQPRKWFRLIPVSLEDYERYYRLPGDKMDQDEE